MSLTEDDKAWIKEIVYAAAESARVDRTGLYLMVIIILLNSCNHHP